MGVRTSDPHDQGYRGSDALTLGALAEAGLLYVTTQQTRAQLMRRLLQAEWSSRPEVITLVLWAIQGQLTGHEWCVCTSCQEVRLMVPTALKDSDAKSYTDEPPMAHAYCHMTPGCLGHMQRIAKRPILTAKLRHILPSATNVNH